MLLLLGQVAPGVDVDVGRVLDLSLAYGTSRWSSTTAASWMGTKDSLVPNRPVFTLTHSGWPVTSSRNTCLASPIFVPLVS